MFDCRQVMATLLDSETDPRLGRDAVRCLPRTADHGSILLIGVVHDHPASVARVAFLLETVSPDVLALELPPLAVPLFELYADDVYTPPRLGGEMSMAIMAAGDVPVVGIDAPNASYLGSVGRSVLARRYPRSVWRPVGRDIVSSSVHALVCRLGWVVGRITGLRLRLYEHQRYPSTLLDSPANQAEGETRHLRKQQAFMRATETPSHRRLIDESRDGVMTARLAELSSEQDVVAIVGMDHLDSLAEQLVSRRS